MLQSDLCDYSDAYIVVKGNIIVEGANNRESASFSLIFSLTAGIIKELLKITRNREKET